MNSVHSAVQKYLEGYHDCSAVSLYGRDGLKHSMHLVFPGICFCSPNVLKQFAVVCISDCKKNILTNCPLAAFVKLNPELSLLDMSCYSIRAAAQNFRVPFSHKFGSQRLLGNCCLVTGGRVEI